MTRAEIANILNSGPLVGGPDQWIVVQPSALIEVATRLKNVPELAFDNLNSVTGIDYPKENLIRVTYHFWSYLKRHDFIVKVELPREDPHVETLCSLWGSANWLEREQYDLLGIKFDKHPDMRRVLLPDDWVGYPHRKDYEEAGGYHGISNTRESPLEGFVRLDSLRKEATKEAQTETKH